ncbi:ABC transporter permease [Sporolactobacillus sp. THM7-7]|nr:ABC transporter permease [Sporolactobacillus sp. THM7-7]
MIKNKKYYTIAGWLAALYFILLFLVPLLRMFTLSFFSEGKISFEYYTTIFTSPVYLRVLYRTLYVSFLVTGIGLVIGYAISYFISQKSEKQQKKWLILVLSPMFMSLTIRLFGWMMLLGQEGLINRVFSWLSPGKDGIPLLFSYTAVAIGIVHYCLPFIILNIYASLKRVDNALIEASLMLGESKVKTFWKVIFPLSLPGIFAAASISFALSASTFLVPLMLGGPNNLFVSNLAYNAIVNMGDYPQGAALSIVLLFIVVIVLSIISFFERRSRIA